VALTIDNSAVLAQKLNARELDFAFRRRCRDEHTSASRRSA